jgi:disulfide bond formation protein DsbB
MLASAPRAYALLAAAVSAAMLATAHIFQRFGYEPCLLCLRQREVYWMALPIAAAGWLLLARRPEQSRVIPAVLAAVFLTGFAVATYHAGAEWKWWPGPKECGISQGGVDAAGLDAFLQGAPVKVIRCDEAAWRMLGLSMAGWNALASLGLAALGLLVAGLSRPSSFRRFARG